MSYKYDDRGNCILKSTSNEGIYDDVNVEYTYDGLDRLVGEKLTLGQNISTYSYAYDKAGNRKSLDIATSIVDGVGEPSRKHVDYTYNSLNQLEKVNDINAPENILNLIYDADGNLTSDGKGIYEYDALGHMSSARLDEKNTLICRYDAEGLRYEVEENERLIKYIYKGRDVVVEENEDGVTRYIRGNGRLIASDSEKARTYYHYVSDNIGSICCVINSGAKDADTNVSDSLSTLKERIECHYEYDAFGNIVVSEEKIRTIFKFTGEQHDHLTNQYYLKARYYNPVIGRFTQTDTYLGDGLNLYAYVKNNPVKYVDPSGHCAKNGMIGAGNVVDKSGSNSNGIYIPMDADGNPIPLKKQRVNGQDIPLPDPAAEGRPHTVLGGKVSSETGEVYLQAATFPGGTWPPANGHDVPLSEVHWTDHGTPHHHTNPHQHIFEYNPDKGGWIRKGPTPYYPKKTKGD